jgi:hypothetical protein
MTKDKLTQINKEFRAKDQSHLWPINGKFNVTERAIGRVRRANQYYGDVGREEYRMQLEIEISRIVNAEEG